MNSSVPPSTSHALLGMYVHLQPSCSLTAASPSRKCGEARTRPPAVPHHRSANDLSCHRAPPIGESQSSLRTRAPRFAVVGFHPVSAHLTEFSAHTNAPPFAQPSSRRCRCIKTTTWVTYRRTSGVQLIKLRPSLADCHPKLPPCRLASIVAGLQRCVCVCVGSSVP